MKKLLFGLVAAGFISTSGGAGVAAETTNYPQTRNEYRLGAVMWYQNAAEVKALQYQAFNIARLRIDQALQKPHDKKLAMVVDVDETILDTSAYEAENILSGKRYASESWLQFMLRKDARATAGAVDLLNYVQSKGVEVFFITNRKIAGLDATYENLKQLGFRVKKGNMILRTTTSDKEERRQKVLKDHEIVVFMGDSLGDFMSVFDAKDLQTREKNVDRMSSLFGSKFIILPNPMYGTWERAIDGQAKDPDSEASLRAARIESLRRFND